MTGKFKIAAIAAFSAILGLATSASHAATSVVTVTDGGTYDGWNITYPEGQGVAVLADVNGSGTLVLEKFADFTSTNSFIITFVQVGTVATTSPTITIVNESITNAVTGTNWSGFNFSLGTPLSGMITPPSFSSTFTPPTGGGVNYTGVSTSPTSITYTGSQPYGTTSLWGEGTGAGELVIDANPSSGQFGQVFTLKETPLTVPVPAAAWSGLTGLMGLGLLASGKKLKKILA